VLSLQAHNSIDRFSGGVRNKGVLFSEEASVPAEDRGADPIDSAPGLEAPERERPAAMPEASDRRSLRGPHGASGPVGSKGHGYCIGDVRPRGALAQAWFGGDSAMSECEISSALGKAA
jgi:hypothetical protein